MSILSKLKSGVSKVKTAVSSAYKKVDSNVFKGRLPGGSVKTISKSPTVTSKPTITASASKTSSGKPTTSTKTPRFLKSKVSKVYNLVDSKIGGLLPGGSDLVIGNKIGQGFSSVGTNLSNLFTGFSQMVTSPVKGVMTSSILSVGGLTKNLTQQAGQSQAIAGYYQGQTEKAVELGYSDYPNTENVPNYPGQTQGTGILSGLGAFTGGFSLATVVLIGAGAYLLLKK